MLPTRWPLLVAALVGCASPERANVGPEPRATVAPSDDELTPAPGGGVTPPARDTPLATSADGQRILFVRGGDLWVARADGNDATLLIQGDGAGSLDGGGDLPLRGFFGVAFHPDGKRALFSVENGRGEAIGAVDLATRKLAWLASAFGFEHVVVPSGPWRGHLLLYQHRYLAQGGTYDECVLVDGWTGKRLRDMTEVDAECGASPQMRRALQF